MRWGRLRAWWCKPACTGEIETGSGPAGDTDYLEHGGRYCPVHNDPAGRLIYVAAPITGNPWGCVRQALTVFGPLRAAGWVPILPQLTVLAEIVEHRPYEDWLAYDLDLIARCDAVYRLPGKSPGADREVAHAHRLGIPVFTDLTQITTHQPKERTT